MAAVNCFPALLTLLLIMTAMPGPALSQQQCSNVLSSLNKCVPFVMPGAGAPSADCCSALQGVDHACLCNMLQVSSRIPTECSLPPLACPAN
ncbi:stamen-specific protein FIL1-like [Andrographis paniculata]|uniref:stamen-specific protein FIL1-like n=1 Tax=Andrographis paniculata TaxID=175694 RepID=UPI0021E94A2C|nr:stamen-specific protein FIL1-like [Andrographis paniculata]